MELKITISFARDESDLYNFLKSKRSASVYIKDLLQVEMDKKPKDKVKEVKENKNNNSDVYIFSDKDLEI